MRVLVTGADGFIGRSLSTRLAASGHDVVQVVRSPGDAAHAAIGDLAQFSDWPPLLEGVDVVVHLAARAHVTSESALDPLTVFRRVNVAPTVRLAQAAASVGVRRFVFVSSIGVNGAATSASRAFVEGDSPNPTDAYAVSKWEAEQGLLETAARTRLQVTRVRPVLVVGAGAKGNLQRLMRLANLGLPLPLGSIRNRRHFVSLEDLCDLLVLCATKPEAADQLFLAAADDAISTPDLIAAIATALGRGTSVFPLPLPIVRVVAGLTGMRRELERMTWSLLVDSTHARQLLGWVPRIALQRAIIAMVRAYQCGTQAGALSVDH
jgi:nucleoside-diphosphate-sugar epimerase